MESAKPRVTLGEFPVGGRLLVRSKKDWRAAVVARKAEEFISLSVASPSGYNYRVRRSVDIHVVFDGSIAVLLADDAEPWRENFTGYDIRW